MLNVVAVEMYIYLTKDETERLRKLSAAKRKEAEKQEELKVFKQRFMHVVKEEPESMCMVVKEMEEPSLRTEARHRGGIKA